MDEKNLQPIYVQISALLFGQIFNEFKYFHYTDVYMTNYWCVAASSQIFYTNWR